MILHFRKIKRIAKASYDVAEIEKDLYDVTFSLVERFSLIPAPRLTTENSL
jgi:hypothetical protein